MSAARSGVVIPREIVAVLLDAGGVLLDLDYPFLMRLLESRGYTARAEDLSRGESAARLEVQRRVEQGDHAHQVWRDYFHLMLAHVRVPAEVQAELIDTLWDAHHRYGLWNVPIPRAIDTVRVLRRRGYRLAVVSNAEGRVEQDLERAGFGGLFDTVVDSHVVGIAKPEPGIFRIALERLGADPGAAIHVGDVPAVDVAGARAAGIHAVLLDRHDLYPDSETPRLRCIEELAGVLDGPLPPAGSSAGRPG